ncbi:MAG: nucleoside monophosphate kinase [Nanoarchaeota archaeon]
MRKILFVGAPGSGKGTQAEFLEKKGFKHISTGELIREGWKRKDPLVMPYKESIEAGNFLPDEVVFKIVLKEINSLKNFKGYVLDGAIRNLAQAKIAVEKGFVEEVVFFKLDEKTAEKRIVNRVKKSKEKRKDDSMDVIKKRFNIYYSETQPILDFLKTKTKYHEVDASPSPEKIHREVFKILGVK